MTNAQPFRVLAPARAISACSRPSRPLGPICSADCNEAGATAANAKSIHDRVLPSKPVAMDLVVWGHEHECQIGAGMDGVEEKEEVIFGVQPTITPSPHPQSPHNHR